MRRYSLAVSLLCLALSIPALSATPTDTQQSQPSSVKSLTRLAQAASTCAADRETIQLMMKNNDRETLRLMLDTIQCPEVRAEGEKWLASTSQP